MPVKCQCIAQTDGAPSDRQEMWKRIFPPDGKVPVIGKLYPGEKPYYLIDFDRVTADQKASIIKEMAIKWNSPEAEVAADITAIGAPVSAIEVLVDLCPLHKTKGDSKVPKRKPEKVKPAETSTVITPPAPSVSGKGAEFIHALHTNDEKKVKEIADEHFAEQVEKDKPQVTITADNNVSKETKDALKEVATKAAEQIKKQQETPISPRLIKTEKWQLYHKLTDDEFHIRSMALSLSFDGIVQEEARQKRIKEDLKAAMSTILSRQATLARSVQTGEELVDVDVDIMIAGDNTVVQEIRKDTGAIINTRPATDYEKQAPLFPGEDLFGDGK